MISSFLEFIKESNKLTTSEFIEKSKEKHGDKYDYSKVDYKRNRDEVTITCKKHGDFNQLAAKHLAGSGCPRCVHIKDAKYNFLELANKIHNNKYEYLSDYISFKKPIEIFCPIHQKVFYQTPQVHLRGSGCTECGRKSIGDNRRHNTDDFIKKSKEKHGDKYDYSKADYKGDDIKVDIICSKHGDFSQRPGHHKEGAGCPSCRESKGEANIAKYLDSISVKYIRGKKFDDCLGVGNRRLPFDFYLPDYNICIEYDGEQHFMPVSVYGGEEKFKKQQINDRIKNEYCEKNGIELLRISYKISGYQKISEEIKKHLGV